MATKKLTVLGDDGAGKKTLIGSLIHQSGLGLLQMGELEREGIQRLSDIVLFYESKGRTQSFYGPSGVRRQFPPPSACSMLMHLTEESPAPDVVFWVVDATDSANWDASAQRLTSLLSGGTTQPREKLVILINKMDLVSWSEETFRAAVSGFSAPSPDTPRTFIVPISSLHGDNMLTSPPEHAWVKNISGGQIGGQGIISEQPLMYLLE